MIKYQFLFLLVIGHSLAQSKLPMDSSRKLQEINISAVRSSAKFLNTYTTLSPKQIESINLGQDVPYLLQSTPSLSYSSDAGNAIGYSSLSIRGSDAQRIQVNINGVPYNDPESHEVYWVNINDLMSQIDDIQIQRDVGYSTTGGTSFGGLISIKTTKKYTKPFVSIGTSIGSFNTFKSNITGSTGIMNHGWQITARASYTQSNGYIDRAASHLQSMYLGLSKNCPKWNTELILLAGAEKTYQAWYGVSQTDIENGYRTKNIAGTDYEQKVGAPYPNQIDHYNQTQIQWISNFSLSNAQNLSTTVYLIRGKGYFEEYKVNQNLSDYNINSSSTSDIVRQLWLDNYLIGTSMSHTMEKGAWENKVALSANKSFGGHYGLLTNIILDPNLLSISPYYNSDARKTDISIFDKIAYSKGNMNMTMDLQVRKVQHEEYGTKEGNQLVQFLNNYLFFNPKIGLNIKLFPHNTTYFFAGLGQKEPNRSDFVDNSIAPKSEKNVNFELGQKWKNRRYFMEYNLYTMWYQDQLVFTGNINAVGAPIRQNVAKSYRMGIEVNAGIDMSPQWKLHTSQSLAMHRILDYNYIIPTYNPDYSLNQALSIVKTYSSTAISMSPNWISYIELQYEPYHNLYLKLMSKTTSKQYLDNTQSDAKSIPTYHYFNVAIDYTLKTKVCKEIKLQLLLNNLLDTKVSIKGYTYNSGNIVQNNGSLSLGQDYNYYFPQAGFNFLAGIKFGF